MPQFRELFDCPSYNTSHVHFMLDTKGCRHTIGTFNNIYCFSTVTILTRTRLNITLYAHCQQAHTIANSLTTCNRLRDARAVGMYPSFYKTRSSVATIPTFRLHWMRNMRQMDACAIWGYRRGAAENAILMGCDAVSFCRLHEQIKTSCSF
jgi:hypothetical protein